MANEKIDANQWFLRIAGGTVFGPVSTKGLIVWAEQGRIVPGNEVSNDRESWDPAETIPELEMNWYVNAGSKTEGPFNRIAAESFLKSGKAPTGAKLIHAKDVDPALLARRNEPAEETEAPKPAPETKQPATARHAATKSAEPKTETDTRDRRIAELEAALEKQRENLATARQAAKTQAALEDERDELRKQMQDLQAQMENFRANADKDAQKRERKLDTLKQEVARLHEEQEAVKSRPMLEFSPAADSAESTADTGTSKQALEELCRQAEDERRVLERDAETLRARIQELETENETLRQSLADAQAESAPLRVKIEKLDQHVAELASQIGQLETERNKLNAERETLQRQLGVAMSEATDATNAAASGELRRRLEQLEAVNAGLRTQFAQADLALADERTAMADLLAASNERDLANHQRVDELEMRKKELEALLREMGTCSDREAKLTLEVTNSRTRIAELQGRLARIPETSANGAARPSESDGWLRTFATDELTSLDKSLHDERQSFNDFRELSTARQEAIQTRIQALQRLLSGDYPDNHARATTPGQRISGLDQTRMQSEIEAIREAKLKEAKQFDEREAELLRRIRVLETEGARLRGLQETTGMESGKRIELVETIRRREQELAQERRNHEQDREQFQSTQHALLRRIEELERTSGGITTDARPAVADNTNPDQPPKPRRLTSLGSWLKK